MNFSLMFIAFLTQIFMRRLAVANTILALQPMELGFDPKNINNSSVFSHNKTVVCILDSWSQWRSEEGSFSISNVDPTLCSQLVYRNAGIDNETFRIKINDPHLSESLGWYEKAVSLSKAHPHLKVLLSVGGWSEGSFSFSKLAADYQKRGQFVESVLRILQQYGFHGIDIAWEYPAWQSRGGTPQDKDNFPLLMNDLKKALDGDYIISLTVAGDTYFASSAYNVRALSKLVDQFNVRSFDFAGAWNDQTYHHSPLNDGDSRQSVTTSVSFYLRNGVPPEKLIVGVPFYGRTFLLQHDMMSALQNPKNDSDIKKLSGLGQPTRGKFGGSWIPDDQLMGYHEICHEILHRGKNEWQTYWDNMCVVPFARENKKWITFDNPESIESKVSFVAEKMLKGVMAWTIDTDDFKGTACKNAGYVDGEDTSRVEITYPLLRTINFVLFKETGQKSSTKIINRVVETESSIHDDSGRSEINDNEDIVGKGASQKPIESENSLANVCRNYLGNILWSLFTVLVYNIMHHKLS